MLCVTSYGILQCMDHCSVFVVCVFFLQVGFAFVIRFSVSVTPYVLAVLFTSSVVRHHVFIPELVVYRNPT